MNWAPKPLRPTLNEGIFAFYKPDIVVKSDSDIERQRRADGTQATRGNITGLQPPSRNAELVLKSVSKDKKKASHDEDECDPEETYGDRLVKAKGVVIDYLIGRGLLSEI